MVFVDGIHGSIFCGSNEKISNSTMLAEMSTSTSKSIVSCIQFVGIRLFRWRPFRPSAICTPVKHHIPEEISENTNHLASIAINLQA